MAINLAKTAYYDVSLGISRSQCFSQTSKLGYYSDDTGYNRQLIGFVTCKSLFVFYVRFWTDW